MLNGIPLSWWKDTEAAADKPAPGRPPASRQPTQAADRAGGGSATPWCDVAGSPKRILQPARGPGIGTLPRGHFDVHDHVESVGLAHKKTVLREVRTERELKGFHREQLKDRFAARVMTANELANAQQERQDARFRGVVGTGTLCGPESALARRVVSYTGVTQTQSLWMLERNKFDVQQTLRWFQQHGTPHWIKDAHPSLTAGAAPLAGHTRCSVTHAPTLPWHRTERGTLDPLSRGSSVGFLKGALSAGETVLGARVGHEITHQDDL